MLHIGERRAGQELKTLVTDDERESGVLAKTLRDSLDDAGVGEHAGFGALDVEIGEVGTRR